MAMLFVEGFDHVGPSYLPAKGWTWSVAPSVSTSLGRTTPGGALNPWQQNHAASKVVPGSPSTIVLGFAVAVYGSTVNANRSIVRFMEGATTHVSVGWDMHKNLCIWQGDMTTLLANTEYVFKVGGSPVDYHYVEIELTVSDTAGVLKVWIDEAPRVNLSGIDTRNGGAGVIDKLNLGLTSPAGLDVLIDDLYCLDKTGTVNNARLGDCSVHTLFPVADLTANWTPSTGTVRWSLLDEQQVNTNTDYISAGGSAQELFTVKAHPTARAINVHTIQTSAIGMRDDATARDLKVLVRPVSTIYKGPALATTSNYSTPVSTLMMETNPETGLKWTKAEYNATAFGVEHV